MGGRVKLPAGRLDPEKLHSARTDPAMKLECCFFWTKDAHDRNTKLYTRKAKDILKIHNMQLDVCPGTSKVPERTLDYSGIVDVLDDNDDMQKVRKLAHACHPDHEGRVPVIFCRMMDSGTYAGGGETLGKTALEYRGWLPFILINVDLTTGLRSTLLHEIGHAAGLVHEPDPQTMPEYRNIMVGTSPPGPPPPNWKGRLAIAAGQLEILAGYRPGPGPPYRGKKCHYFVRYA